eukprot:s1350_g12.t1
MDNSSWALRVDPPKFFWETDPFLNTVFGQGSVTGLEPKRPAVDLDLTVREPTDVFAMLRKPKQVRVSGLCEQVIKHVEVCSGRAGPERRHAELGTARVDGMAVELGKRAGPILQASPLLVSQVIALEKLVATTQDLKDRVAYGAMLVLLYSCGRFSDGQRAVNMILDVERSSIDHGSIDCPGFVELQVLGKNGARSDVLRRTYLPLVAPVYSLGSFGWFQAWLQAREILGLEISGKLTAPLLCRFGADGVPLQQEITSSECGKLLRRALRVDEDGSSGIRSHSLKATALSWAGKFGVGLETRRLLGHHLDANAKSAEAYNRDSMGPAVEQLVKTLQAIKQGSEPLRKVS